MTSKTLDITTNFDPGSDVTVKVRFADGVRHKTVHQIRSRVGVVQLIGRTVVEADRLPKADDLLLSSIKDLRGSTEKRIVEAQLQ